MKLSDTSVNKLITLMDNQKKMLVTQQFCPHINGLKAEVQNNNYFAIAILSNCPVHTNIRSIFYHKFNNKQIHSESNTHVMYYCSNTYHMIYNSPIHFESDTQNVPYYTCHIWKSFTISYNSPIHLESDTLVYHIHKLYATIFPAIAQVHNESDTRMHVHTHYSTL